MDGHKTSLPEKKKKKKINKNQSFIWNISREVACKTLQMSQNA